MGTLNRSKPFGTVSGISPYQFEQGGRFFNSQGNEVDKDGNLLFKPQPVPSDPGLTVVVEPKNEQPPETPVEDPPATETNAQTADTDTEQDSGDGYGSRYDIMTELERLNIPYNPKVRRSKLIELLKGRTEGQ